MQFLKVGILFLLCLPGLAIAQVSGTVESIGFASYFRPDCWTPMVITVTPETAKTDFFQIHIKLQDLDRDLPIYERTISVTGSAEGQNRVQRFRMYFIPPPTDHGLPDAGDAGALKELREKLKVSLYTNAPTPKWICDLPITGALQNVDPTREAYAPRRGTKFLVSVSDGNSRATYNDPAAVDVLGVTEDVAFVNVRSDDLPESVLGYDAVDGVVWLDADPSSLKASGDEKFRALEQYVRRGGKLVICQPAEWQKILGFGAMLPVSQIDGIQEKADLEPLRTLAKPKVGFGESYINPDFVPQYLVDPLSTIRGPYRFARAVPKADAIVDDDAWIEWPATAEQPNPSRTPYIVRRVYGLGSVTWVAQDLGDPILTGSRYGWMFVWNRVFDWKMSPIPTNSQTPQEVKRRFDQGSPVDVGPSLIGNWMDLQSKSAGLIALAVLFFIGYWLLAGPGIYAFLATKQKTHLSWFWFGACAFLATACTVLIVRLVLRGPPELKHLSIVRVAPDQPALVVSRFGLYIPRDGNQKIELKDAAPQSVTTISALPIHPALLKDTPAESGSEYTVPIIDSTSTDPASLTFKYRSTLKKFQATWVGEKSGKIQGSAKLLEEDYIGGRLTNGTEQRLENVYIAFNYPGSGIRSGDWILYIPAWNPGTTLDLAKEFNKQEDGSPLQPTFDTNKGPDRVHKLRGKLTADWKPYLLGNVRGNTGFGDTFEDGAQVRKSFLILSLFERLPPQENQVSGYGRVANMGRADLLRRGARMMDMSGVIAAGGMVVLAEAAGGLPMPLEVEGSAVEGSGLNFYQFVVPLDHSGLAATTEPSTTQEAAK